MTNIGQSLPDAASGVKIKQSLGDVASHRDCLMETVAPAIVMVPFRFLGCRCKRRPNRRSFGTGANLLRTEKSAGASVSLPDPFPVLLGTRGGLIYSPEDSESRASAVGTDGVEIARCRFPRHSFDH